MTIVQFTTIHPRPGVEWGDVQKQIKKACDLARKHGAENVTVLVTMIGGQATNTIGVLSSAEDWAKYGKVQQAFLNDPETQAVMQEGGQIATWETYVSQTIPDM
jgi:sugar phosphate isomerase/epimerase